MRAQRYKSHVLYLYKLTYIPQSVHIYIYLNRGDQRLLGVAASDLLDEERVDVRLGRVSHHLAGMLVHAALCVRLSRAGDVCNRSGGISIGFEDGCSAVVVVVAKDKVLSSSSGGGSGGESWGGDDCGCEDGCEGGGKAGRGWCNNHFIELHLSVLRASCRGHRLSATAVTPNARAFVFMGPAGGLAFSLGRSLRPLSLSRHTKRRRIKKEKKKNGTLLRGS